LFYEQGARFTKFRCVLEISTEYQADGSKVLKPSQWSIDYCAHTL